MEFQLISELVELFKKNLNITVPDVHEQVLNNTTQNNDCGDLDRRIGPDGICIETIKSTLNKVLLF